VPDDADAGTTQTPAVAPSDEPPTVAGTTASACAQDSQPVADEPTDETPLEHMVEPGEEITAEELLGSARRRHLGHATAAFRQLLRPKAPRSLPSRQTPVLVATNTAMRPTLRPKSGPRPPVDTTTPPRQPYAPPTKRRTTFMGWVENYTTSDPLLSHPSHTHSMSMVVTKLRTRILSNIRLPSFASNINITYIPCWGGNWQQLVHGIGWAMSRELAAAATQPIAAAPASPRPHVFNAFPHAKPMPRTSTSYCNRAAVPLPVGFLGVKSTPRVCAAAHTAEIGDDVLRSSMNPVTVAATTVFVADVVATLRAQESPPETESGDSLDSDDSIFTDAYKNELFQAAARERRDAANPKRPISPSPSHSPEPPWHIRR
jgi:hypothetical protein